MCGRAGRLGLDASGQAVLMINDGPAERAAAAALVAKDLDPLASRLHDARGGGLHKLLLEMVCLGRLRRVGDVPAFTQVGLVMQSQWSPPGSCAGRCLISSHFPHPCFFVVLSSAPSWRCSTPRQPRPTPTPR